MRQKLPIEMFSPIEAFASSIKMRDRLALVLDPLLIHEDALLVEGLELPAHDLLDHLLWLAGVLRLLRVDRRLFVDDLLRDLVAGRPRGVREGDVHRNVFRQPLEPLGLRHEVRLAVQLDENAELRRVVRIGAMACTCTRSPREADRPVRLAASARPFSRRIRLAASRSPSASVRAFCNPSSRRRCCPVAPSRLSH